MANNFSVEQFSNLTGLLRAAVESINDKVQSRLKMTMYLQAVSGMRMTADVGAGADQRTFQVMG